MLRFFLALLFLALMNVAFAQQQKNRWVDSVFQTLKQEEKMGQLFLVSTSSYDSKDQIKILMDQVKEQKVGGLVIRQSGPVGYVRLLNTLQSQARIPLLISTHLSNGLSSIIDSLMHFYAPTLLDAITSDSLIFEISKEQSRLKILLGNPLNFSDDGSLIGDLKVIDVSSIPTRPKAKQGDEERKTLSMGGDFLFKPKDIDAAIKTIVKVVKKDKTLAAQLDHSVTKILSAKFDAGLAKNKFIDTDNIISKLNTPEAKLLKQQLAEAAVTVVQNNPQFIPIQKLDDTNFASISFGEESKNEFTHYLSKYVRFTHFSVKVENDTAGLSSQLKKQQVIVIGIFPSSDSWIKKAADQINKLARSHQVIVCSFSNPLDLHYFENIPTLVAAYSDENEIQKAAAQIIFGGIGAKGKLPVKISEALPEGTSISTKTLNRFSYSLPEAVGMDSKTLQKIESIAQEAIAIGGTPGCHVQVVKDGKVVYEKSFGWLTYEKKIPVTDETIYDLASVTKVSATLQAVMYMQENGLIDINKKASVYLPELKKSNKEDYVIKDILTHQAGLWPYLPFWSETVKDPATFKKYYSHSANANYFFPVAEGLYANKFMKDSLWQWIIKAKVRDKPSRSIFDYRYSDMGFYIMQHLGEKVLRQPQEEFLQSKIYRPLGASSIGYLPLRKFPPSQIAPTENDTLFRKSLLVGYVHDQGAAMHGGIAGHAGLFSNANDLAKLGQMWLNKGSYGGVQFFKPETLDLFTSKQYEDSRRGLGWDKPTPSDWNGPTSSYASAKTFGHTGFTGTCIWVDPEFNLVYVFLSNRVHPDMNNTKILSANIRPRIQEVIYQSIFEYCKNHPAIETK